MTYIADLDPNNPRIAADEARRDFFDSEFPEWEVREGMGDRFLTERDMPVYDDTADLSRVSNEDWEAMGEALWTDHRL